MRSQTHPTFRSLVHRVAHSAAAMAAVLAMAACGGGGTTSDNGATTASTVSNSGVAQSGLRALPSDYLTRRAVAYSPFRSNNRDTETITDAMVKQDLDLMAAAGIGLIRLFDSSEKVAARTLRLIRANNIDIKVQLGVYPNSYEYTSASAATLSAIQSSNDAEVARGVALANSYPDIVVAVSVGNETQVTWSFVTVSSRKLSAYIKTVRDQVVQPVTTDDNYAVMAGQLPHHAAENQISEVLAQLDFVSIHTYPMLDVPYSNPSDSDPWPDWNWQQSEVADANLRAAAMMDAAVGKAKQDFSLARSYLDAKGKSMLPIIIGETGWMAVDPSGTGRYKFLAHPANQKMYYERLLAWVDATKNSGGPKSIIYFEAFDEPWKGSDDKWGLFNVNRQARYSIQAKNANNTVLNATATWTYEPSTKAGGTAYVDSDALYFTPPTLKTALTSSRYTLFADTVTAGETLGSTVTPDLRWDAFDGTTAAYPTVGTASAPSDPSSSLEITPTPAIYGWGLLYQSPSNSNENLSAFDTATGTLNFSVKTSYVGALEVGFSTDTADRSGAEVFLRLTNGSYSYCNTGAWCNVSIPLSAFKAANPKIDLRYVLSRFIVADRYAYTGNTSQTTKINIDNIYWSR